MESNSSDRVCLVTSASKGVGYRLVKELSKKENEHLFNLPGVIVCQHIDYDDIRMEVLSIEGCSEGWRLSPSGN